MRLIQWGKSHKLLIAVLAVGFFLRLFYIGNIPGNRSLYSDEAFAGYEAFSILNYGYDSQGYRFPVYLETWGSGMSAMQSYCIVPFMAVFGVNSFSIRLPQAILGCITLIVVYLLAREIRDDRFALIMTAVLTVMPWHIMSSRWAYDCNYFTGFLAIATLLLVKSVHNMRFFPWAMIVYGLSLYCYAVPWMVMPFVLAGSLIFLLRTKRISMDRHFFIGLLLVGLLALPLLLFLCVNAGMISEIRTPFISIPHISRFRGNEMNLSFKAILQGLYRTYVMLVTQNDGRLTGASSMFGLYYKFSIVFIAYGMGVSVYHLAKRDYVCPLEVLIIIQLVGGFILGGLLEEVLVHRINIIHIPMIWFCAVGIYEAILRFKARAEVIAVPYIVSCVMFMAYYFTEYDDTIADVFFDGAKQAIEHVETVRGDRTIHTLGGVVWPLILLYAQVPTDEYVTTVEYLDTELTGGSLVPVSFTHYDLTGDFLEPSEWGDAIRGDIYMCDHENESAIAYLEGAGFQITYYDNFVVAE